MPPATRALLARENAFTNHPGWLSLSVQCILLDIARFVVKLPDNS